MAAFHTKRKFSFDIPKLKVGPLRPDVVRAWKDHYAGPPSPESRPPTPRSVRPPLPSDIDAELKAACSYIVTHPKPSHEVWTQEAARPALDYAAVKAGGLGDAGSMPVRSKSTRQYRAEPSRIDLLESSRYTYKPHVATQDLFRPEACHNGAQFTASARSRADVLMSGDGTRQPSTTAHSRQRSESTNQLCSSATSRAENIEKARLHAASGSGTSGSTPHTDSTDYPWSASTGITSAAMTPARSQRTSSQAVASGSESGSAPKVEAVNFEWMRQELEKHKEGLEKKPQVAEAESSRRPALPARVSSQSPVTMASFSQVPTRKPVPSSRPDSRQATNTSRPDTRQELRASEQESYTSSSDRRRVDSHQQDDDLQIVEAESRGRTPGRSDSRVRYVSRAASRAASRAVADVKSVTQDILGHYFRPQSAQEKVDLIERPPSRARDIAYAVGDYIRPGSAARPRSRNASIDLHRGHGRAPSLDSFRSVTSGTAASERSSQRKSHLRPVRANGGLGPRDGNDGLYGSAQQAVVTAKPLIDLNRELPPLPSLDSWKDDEPAAAPVVQAAKLKPAAPPGSMANEMASAFHWPRRAVSRGSMRHDPMTGVATKEDGTAARTGAPSSPTLPGSSTMSSPGNLREVSTLAVGYNMNLGDASSKSGGRLRNLTKKWSRTTLRRKDSLGSLPTRGQSEQRMPHVADYSRQTGPPLSGTSRARAKAGVLLPKSSSAYGHSRGNSQATLDSQKYSTDDDSHANDSWYQNSVTIRIQLDSRSEKARKHWWQVREKQRRDACWMDQVVKSGATNGMLINENGVPVVRF